MRKLYICLTLILFILCVAAGRLDANQPLSDMLNTDGTLSLDPGFQGSLDPSGYSMITDEDGTPRFVPEESDMHVHHAQYNMTNGIGNWSPLTSGVNNVVHAIACSGHNVYIGGAFTEAGGIPANHIARWNGTSWSTLGSGVNWGVWSIAVSGDDVYVGGAFSQAGGVPASCIARWDGTTWSALGNGVNAVVKAIACSGHDVYAGGQFTQAGGTSVWNIAKWDGSSWSALGSGVMGYVEAIDISGNDVFAGGYFTQAGGAPANHIARWNGTSWSPLGSGVDGLVCSIACSGNDVYAGGDFINAGGSSAWHIAKWNGSSWSALGNGLNGHAWAIAVSGEYIYAAGYFTQAGGVPANHIAKWNGSLWLALGSGTDDYTWTLAYDGIDLYAGGDFLNAGGISCPHVAVYHTLPIFKSFTDVSAGDLTIDAYRSIGCAWSDYDDAGDPDLFVANEGLQDNNNNLYVNNGNGTFTGLTSGNVVSDGARSQGGTWGDYNNDGYPDLFVSNANGENNLLYENTNGVLYAVGLDPLTSDGGNSNGAAWADYDNDGYLDLFVANGGENNFLYHNNGNSTFSKVNTGPVVTDGGASTSAAWCDYDLDGDMDLFVPNTGWNVNFLYTNNGDGTFTKVTTGDIVSNAGEAFGGSWGDYDNDGYPDLYVPQSGQDNLMYHNNGDGTFTKVTDGIMVNDGLRSRSSGWGDLNLDGHLDLFVVNRNVNSHIHINNGDGTFISYLIDPAVDGYGGAWSDYDLDGDLDLFICQYNMVNHLFEYTGTNHWLKLKCIGVTSNRDGVGAKVKIRTGPDWQYREINTQSGFGGQSDLVVEFGVGAANALIDEVVIEWPSGIVWDTTDVNVDKMLIITEHESAPNQPPVAVDDNVTIEEDGTTIIEVLENDSDPDGDALVIESIDDTGTTGTVGINSGNTSVSYIAAAGFTGTDQFSYVVSDGQGGQDDAVVTVEVEPASAVMNRSGIPKVFYLAQNHPNPFNPETEITYGLPKNVDVRLTLYDMTGREVVQLVNHHQQAGAYSVIWDGRDHMGSMVSSGIYVYHLAAGEFSKQCKMLLIR